MRLLVISPDYASHATPMIQVAAAWQQQYGDAVVATGDATRSLVETAGLQWVHLRLGKGSNAGVIRVEDQPVGEDDHLRAFFDATRAGPVQTLRYQAQARRHDLLYEPDRVLDKLRDIIDATRPDRILVDHVAFGARLALHAAGCNPATIVLGHPTALPADGEWYGMPGVWPSTMQPDPADATELEELCRQSTCDLQEAAAELMTRRAPTLECTVELTSLAGSPTIYAYPSALHDPARSIAADSVFVGSLARDEDIGEVELPPGTGPLVLVALGSFLSARDDVLATAVEAAHRGGWRLLLAHGSSDPDRLGTFPDGAIVAANLAQVALLQYIDVMVTHGGNNSVAEASAAGVPMVVMPFSTDQFAGAASIERAGTGVVLAPNGVTADQLVAAVTAVLDTVTAERAAAVSESIRLDGGAARAAAAIAAGSPVVG
jgi:zeaxanthin glucosyltransferase